jgi:hypothetical protein
MQLKYYQYLIVELQFILWYKIFRRTALLQIMLPGYLPYSDNTNSCITLSPLQREHTEKSGSEGTCTQAYGACISLYL